MHASLVCRLCDKDWLLRQHSQGIRLTRGSAGDGFKILLGEHPRGPHRVLLLGPDFSIPNRHWQHAANGRFERAAVVVTHPARQFQERRTDHRLLIQQFGNVPHLGEFRFLQNFNHRARQKPGPHWHPNPRPNSNRRLHSLRNAVIQHSPGGLVR